MFACCFSFSIKFTRRRVSVIIYVYCLSYYKIYVFFVVYENICRYDILVLLLQKSLDKLVKGTSPFKYTLNPIDGKRITSGFYKNSIILRVKIIWVNLFAFHSSVINCYQFASKTKSLLNAFAYVICSSRHVSFTRPIQLNMATWKGM